jgi:hypothetical protein
MAMKNPPSVAPFIRLSLCPLVRVAIVGSAIRGGAAANTNPLRRDGSKRMIQRR